MANQTNPARPVCFLTSIQAPMMLEIPDEYETVSHHRIESFRELNWSARKLE
jgi:hypothetical protein